MKNKKVLLELCMSPDLGGLELYMVRAAKALKDRFKVISIINKNGKLEQYYEDGKDSYIALEKKSNLLIFGAAKQLANIIDEKNVDVIHVHWTKDLPLVVLSKLLSKKRPKVVQTRNMTMTRFKDDFYHRFLYKNIDLMLPVTYQVKEQLEKFIPQDIRPQIEVLYMGSDKPELLEAPELKAFKEKTGLREDIFNIGMVGRINEAKGQYLLIEALSKMQQKNAEVFFVGHEMDKGYIQKLQKMAADLGVGSRVHFLGFMKNPHHFFQACDVIVMASRRETFGLVVIEAMQMGTAVVGSNSGGVVEIIDDEKTGLLFEMGNSDDLARKLERLQNDEALLNTIAHAGMMKCQEKFSNYLQFEKLGSILQGIV
ncbi:glycosyltransferase family 4 protein [Sulfurimonas paralvinellae]|uniref:Glycosyltransferase family 4 protein n=1 Tax=Sulfurimonas paralvinellae TaxID=317658 RepID=A0A7M1BBF5_9BACT|nr:glycosyltransferase family 4 protein [Sulfurimonas paralvinellae]QOP46122.1 glycosyltransferase family 4 protein [Sulfurimonas paralvinellae]